MQDPKCKFCEAGVFTVLGPMPKISGSQNVINLLTGGLKKVVNASFAVEPGPEKAADLIIDHIGSKRKDLGI